MKSSSKLRVLMLVENNPYPQDVRVLAEAQALKTAGYPVTVICPAKKGQPLRENVDGVWTFRYPQLQATNSSVSYFIEYGWSFLCMFYLTLIAAFWPGFDVIHAANPPDTLVLIAIFQRLFGKKFVFDHHDLMPELYQIRFPQKAESSFYHILVGLEKLSCRRADQIIATNQSYKALEMARSGVSAEKITVVRNGPPKQLCPVEPEPGLRMAGKIIYVYMGVIGYQDGLDHLVRAIDYMVKELKRTDFMCYVMGSGDALESIRKMSGELGLNDYISFTGWVEHDRIAGYLSAADICVAPEPSNPYNDRCTIIKLMEYMAVGKPIVAFDLPEHHVTAQDGAIYAQPNDVQDFARKMISLADDADLCHKMGQSGRDRIVNELSWPYQSQHLLQVYKRLEEKS